MVVRFVLEFRVPLLFSPVEKPGHEPSLTMLEMQNSSYYCANKSYPQCLSSLGAPKFLLLVSTSNSCKNMLQL